jgi:hypothetical protein
MVVAAPAPDEGRKQARLFSKHQVSPCRARLLELMQALNFGRIERLPVRAGEPVLDPLPTIVREVKFGGENGVRDERSLGDFVLKDQVVELFKELDRLRDGLIDVLTVKRGLPFNMHLNLEAGAR